MLSSLSGIRGYAVLLVLLAHSSNLGYHLLPDFDFTGAGKNGVFIFFSLSAFLLGRQFFVYQNKTEKKEIDFTYFTKRYIAKRFIRIYPLFILALITYLSISIFIQPVYIENWDVFFNTLFLIDGPGIFWTIAVEFKFYIVLPIIVLITLFLKVNKYFVFTFYTAFIYFSSCISVSDSSVALSSYLTFFIAGVFGAYLYVYFLEDFFCDGNSKFIKAIINLLNVTSLLFLTLLVPDFFDKFFNVEISKEELHENHFIMSVFSVFLILTSLNSSCWLTCLFQSKFMKMLGDISFTVYLGHMLIIYLFVFLDVTKSTFTTTLMYTLIILISYLVYRLVEKPLVDFGYNKIKNYK